ncbi:MAG: ATP-binding protein [Candidatus Aenigmatarchaeota archaeon]|nr:MAG: ATP-binding protein [Candidatus Aenigmarchaeota archaeon]
MEILNILNPWWEKDGWEREDKHLRELSLMKVRWIPKWLNKLSFKPFSLNFLVGPRQIGKTTGMKLLIKQLTTRVNKYAVFYLDIEILRDLEELREVILFYQKIKKENRIKHAYIFLDEVTSLKEWWRIIKGFIDSGVLNRDVITVSGSSTLNILKQREAFPGRRGFGKDIEALPLSFPEFLEIKGVDISKKSTFKHKIHNLFSEYLEVGGYPKSINKINFFPDLIRSIESEIEKTGKSPETLKQIISMLYDMVPSAMSYNTIGSKIGISHKTVESYIEDLQNLFALKIVYHKDKRVNFRKEKKILIRDPYLARSLAIWCNRELRKDFLFESIVQEHLYRKFGEIYYFRNSYEIDCIAGDMKVEVKAGKPHRKYPKNVLVLEEKEIPEFLISLK